MKLGTFLLVLSQDQWLIMAPGRQRVASPWRCGSGGAPEPNHGGAGIGGTPPGVDGIVHQQVNGIRIP